MLKGCINTRQQKISPTVSTALNYNLIDNIKVFFKDEDSIPCVEGDSFKKQYLAPEFVLYQRDRKDYSRSIKRMPLRFYMFT